MVAKKSSKSKKSEPVVTTDNPDQGVRFSRLNNINPIFVVFFASLVLTALIIRASAAPVGFASVEIEGADNLQGGTSVGSDSSASDGEFLAFSNVEGEAADVGNTDPTVEEDDPVQDNTDDPDPAPTDAVPNTREGFPNANNTGIRASGLKESDLSRSNQPTKWVIKKDGTVVDRVIHNGFIVVQADDVTIRNTIVRGTASKLIDNKGRNLRIENSLVEGGNLRTNLKVPSPCDAAIGSGNYTAIRVDVSQCADGFKISASVTILDSYIHNLYADRRSGGSGTHNDGVQQNNRGRMERLVFRGNSVYLHPCTSNRAFQLGLEGGDLYGNYLIENNFFWGSIGVINAEDKSGNSSGRGTATIRNNLIAGTQTEGPFSDNGRSPSQNIGLYTGGFKKSISGNKFEDGSSADAGKYRPYTCNPNFN